MARWRPLAERGRETVSVESSNGRKRSNWTYAELTLDGIDAACELARERLRPDTVDDLLHEGRQRALIYATLVSTGLRRGELASVRMRDIHLDESPAFIALNAADEKNREGSTIILRDDLANDLRAWIAERSQQAADATLNAPTIRFDRKAVDDSQAGTLSPDTKLFDVPDRRCLLRIIDKDFALAGIPKVDERGRSVDIHCLRHSFATNLARAGVAPKVAQELLRHSDVNLTLSVYSHASAFDVASALESLPALNTSGTPNPERPALRATGTLAKDDSPFAPTFAPKAGDGCTTLSLSGKLGDLSGSTAESSSDTKRAENPGKPAVFGSSEKYTREDSNLQPPVPKTGALSN